MIVYFDYQIFSRQRRGGVSRLFVELGREFTSNIDLGVTPIFGYQLARNDYIQELQSRRVTTVPEGSAIDNWRICSSINLGAHKLSPPTADIHHLTYYDDRVIRRRRSSRIVSTLIDFIPERMPEHFSHRAPHLSKIRVLERSDLILCISETVRLDLEDLYPSLASKAVAIPLGTRPLKGGPASERKPNLLIYVGSRTGYKRFDILIEALRHIDRREVELVCVGGGPFTTSEMAALESLPRTTRATQRQMTDTELVALYKSATMLVSTSAAEGFGLPAVEAMGFGCPVVLTDIPAYRETSGSSAVLVPVAAAEELGAAIASLLDSPSELAHLSRSSWERAQQLTWAKTAQLTAAAYRSIL